MPKQGQIFKGQTIQLLQLLEEPNCCQHHFLNLHL